MTIKRCYPVLVGASVAENQLCNGESVTVPNGHKYYLKKSGTESLGASTGTAITGLISGSDMVIDLTQKLGSSIADRAYTLEQATAGSGIAWLRSYGFLGGYQAYNAGSIESVEVTAKVVRDENNENAVTYPLGSDVLRGIFKLDANNQLYADGDRKESDGTITRKYGVVDLGTLNWSMSTSGTYKRFYSGSINAVIAKPETPNDIAKLVCARYTTDSFTRAYVGRVDKIIAVTDNASSARGNVNVVDDSYTDDASFKTAMSGVYLVYELATPTTEQSTPFTSPQIVYPDGTEEFVTENGVPVGHETKYQL